MWSDGILVNWSHCVRLGLGKHLNHWRINPKILPDFVKINLLWHKGGLPGSTAGRKTVGARTVIRLTAAHWKLWIPQLFIWHFIVIPFYQSMHCADIKRRVKTINIFERSNWLAISQIKVQLKDWRLSLRNTQGFFFSPPKGEEAIVWQQIYVCVFSTPDTAHTNLFKQVGK